MSDGPAFIPPVFGDPAFGETRIRGAHPFRRTLPDRVLRLLPEYEPEVKAAMARAASRAERALIVEVPTSGTEEVTPQPVPRAMWRRFTAQDVRDFALTYLACLAAVATFIF